LTGALATIDVGPQTTWPKAVRDPRERERFILGLCIKCGDEPMAPGKSCWGAVCKEERRKYGAARYDRLRSEKLCTQCGVATPTRGVRCEPCYQDMAKASAAAQAKRIAAGLCEKCTRPRAEGSASYCAKHRDRENELGRLQRQARINASPCACGARAVALRDNQVPVCKAHKKKRPSRTIVHGTNHGYRRGCRCQPCKTANTARCLKNRRARVAGKVCACGSTSHLCVREDGRVQCRACLSRENAAATAKPIKHGTRGGYTNRGCRCEACRQACRDDGNAYRRRRRVQAATGGST
jgi:hypothetical protein